MTVPEKIQLYLERLPHALQAEVLDFVEYLLAKAERREEDDWRAFSLASAMRGMEDEETPTYTLEDLKVLFE